MKIEAYVLSSECSLEIWKLSWNEGKEFLILKNVFCSEGEGEGEGVSVYTEKLCCADYVHCDHIKYNADVSATMNFLETNITHRIAFNLSLAAVGRISLIVFLKFPQKYLVFKSIEKLLRRSLSQIQSISKLFQMISFS